MVTENGAKKLVVKWHFIGVYLVLYECTRRSTLYTFLQHVYSQMDYIKMDVDVQHFCNFFLVY